MKILENYYQTGQNAINANRELATQKADIAFESAKKYMPVQNKMNGLSGLGVSDSASLEMYNQHLNRKNALESSYDTASSDLFKDYLTDRQALADKEAADEKTRKTENYNRIVDTINTGNFDDVDALANYINQSYWNGDLSEDDYNDLIQRQNHVRESADYRGKRNNLFWYEDQNAGVYYANDAERRAAEAEAEAERKAAENEEILRKTENFNYLAGIISDSLFTDVDELARMINNEYWNGNLTKDDYNRLIYLQNQARESPYYRGMRNNLFWYEDNNLSNPYAANPSA